MGIYPLLLVLFMHFVILFSPMRNLPKPRLTLCYWDHLPSISSCNTAHSQGLHLVFVVHHQWRIKAWALGAAAQRPRAEAQRPGAEMCRVVVQCDINGGLTVPTQQGFQSF